jgi:hypothetical protein
MITSNIESLSASQKPMDTSHALMADSAWKPLYRIAGVAALLMVVFIAIQSIVFLAWPPPSTVIGYFTLFQHNWFLGLLSLDLVYLLSHVLLVLIYLALYAALRRASPSFMAIALTLGLVGIAAYFASNTAFEMLSLSNQYAAATTDAQRSTFEASGQAMLAIYQGTAFDVYYVLSTFATLIISVVMLRSTIFSKGTAYVGIVTGVLMLVPSTVGTIGPYFGLMSLVPFAIWCILIARRLFQLAQGASKEEAKQPAVA